MRIEEFKKMHNPKIKNLKTHLLSDNWYTLNKITYDIQNEKGQWESHEREAYDRGNGAVILLYNKSNKKVILTRQFRIPTYVNGNDNGHAHRGMCGDY